MVEYNKGHKINCSVIWFLFLNAYAWSPVVGFRRYIFILGINLIIAMVLEYISSGKLDPLNFVTYILVSTLGCIVSLILA